MPRSGGVGSKGMPWLLPGSVISQNSGNRDVLQGCSTPAFLSVQLSAGGRQQPSGRENSFLPSSHFMLSLLRSFTQGEKKKRKKKLFQSAV